MGDWRVSESAKRRESRRIRRSIRTGGHGIHRRRRPRNAPGQSIGTIGRMREPRRPWPVRKCAVERARYSSFGIDMHGRDPHVSRRRLTEGTIQRLQRRGGTGVMIGRRAKRIRRVMMRRHLAESVRVRVIRISVRISGATSRQIVDGVLEEMRRRRRMKTGGRRARCAAGSGGAMWTASAAASGTSAAAGRGLAQLALGDETEFVLAESLLRGEFLV